MATSTLALAMTPSTWAGHGTATALSLAAVTSSGVYFPVGDGNKLFIVSFNRSTDYAGSMFIEPGSSVYAGATGQARSTASTSAYSTATAPYAWAISKNASSMSSEAILSTSLVIAGPFETEKVKSSDGYIFLIASTESTECSAAVFALGSTN